MKLRSRILFVTGLVLAAAPITSFADRKLTAKEATIVGTWVWNQFNFSRHVKVRYAKGNFVEYRFQEIDANKPAVTLTMRGTWKLTSKHYCETYTAVSFSRWHDIIGRTSRLNVAEQKGDTFLYVSQDGAPIDERKLSPEEAEKVLRNPFGYLTADVPSRPGVEAH